VKSIQTHGPVGYTWIGSQTMCSVLPHHDPDWHNRAIRSWKTIFDPWLVHEHKRFVNMKLR